MTTQNDINTLRQRAMGVMAKSELKAISDCWQTLNITLDYDTIKPAQVGMAMVRAQAGTEGLVYNQGEMTVTRCVLQEKATQVMGVGYTQGRSKQKATLMAEVDLALQNASHQNDVIEKLVEPLEQAHQRAVAQQNKATDATKVDFFTMVRGE